MIEKQIKLSDKEKLKALARLKEIEEMQGDIWIEKRAIQSQLGL